MVMTETLSGFARAVVALGSRCWRRRGYSARRTERPSPGRSRRRDRRSAEYRSGSSHGGGGDRYEDRARSDLTCRWTAALLTAGGTPRRVHGLVHEERAEYGGHRSSFGGLMGESVWVRPPCARLTWRAARSRPSATDPSGPATCRWPGRIQEDANAVNTCSRAARRAGSTAAAMPARPPRAAITSSLPVGKVSVSMP